MDQHLKLAYHKAPILGFLSSESDIVHLRPSRLIQTILKFCRCGQRQCVKTLFRIFTKSIILNVTVRSFRPPLRCSAVLLADEVRLLSRGRAQRLPQLHCVPTVLFP